MKHQFVSLAPCKKLGPPPFVRNKGNYNKHNFCAKRSSAKPSRKQLELVEIAGKYGFRNAENSTHKYQTYRPQPSEHSLSDLAAVPWNNKLIGLYAAVCMWCYYRCGHGQIEVFLRRIDPSTKKQKKNETKRSRWLKNDMSSKGISSPVI